MRLRVQSPGGLLTSKASYTPSPFVVFEKHVWNILTSRAEHKIAQDDQQESVFYPTSQTTQFVAKC